MFHPPMFRRVHAEAKLLMKAIKNCDPAALKVLRTAYPTAAPISDTDLIAWANLQRIQHAYAVQQGCSKWDSLLKKISEDWADSVIADEVGDLTETDEFGTALASTNACWFIVDDYEIKNIAFDKSNPEVVRISISWSSIGEQIDDKPFCGDTIKGSAVLVVDGDQRHWEDIGAGVEDDWRDPTE